MCYCHSTTYQRHLDRRWVVLKNLQKHLLSSNFQANRWIELNRLPYEDLLNHFWKNIDPFDANGQFCDKGYSYRSVAFHKNDEQKRLIEKSMMILEKKFNKKIVTYVVKFDKFYRAEEMHQNYYEEKFLSYLRYKKACGREKTLNRIWN